MEKIFQCIKVRSINETDIKVIWDSLSYHIREELLTKKRGVTIPSFGTFTFVERRLDIGNRTELVKLRPVLVLSARFCQTHAIKSERAAPTNGSIPVSLINYTTLSEIISERTRGQYAYGREIVERVLTEAFMAIDHFVRRDARVSVPFNGLGCFVVDTSTLKSDAFFQFDDDILNRLPYLF